MAHTVLMSTVSELALELSRSDFIVLPLAGVAAQVHPYCVHHLNSHTACGSPLKVSDPVSVLELTVRSSR